jgi:hypothetical protein
MSSAGVSALAGRHEKNPRRTVVTTADLMAISFTPSSTIRHVCDSFEVVF